jgi:ACS family hexuronate transporter-like MFS transporter
VPTAAKPGKSRFRWVICGLLFFATVIAYLDRGVLSYLEKNLEGIIGWNSEQYSHMTAAFTLAYAIGLVTAGGLTDRLGTRRAFALAIVLWSVAAMLPGAAYSVSTFTFAMFLLGIGEAANFPACIKTVAEWFPKKERALATGIFNSGANVGPLAVPVVVPFLTDWFTWRGAFVVTGSLGFVWLAAWLLLYYNPQAHVRVSQTELDHIQSDPVESTTAVPWSHLLPVKETWAFALAKFFTDPVWWFYLFWLPRYLQETFHLDIKQNRLPVIVAYAASMIGGVGGGWLSSVMIRRGWSLNAARKTAMLVCALCVLPVLYVPFAGNLWVVTAVMALAMAGHCGWSANAFTLASDMFPRVAVASVVGIGGMMGAIGGFLLQLTTGKVLAVTHSYLPMFAISSAAYIVALGIVQLISPTLAPAKLKY